MLVKKVIDCALSLGLGLPIPEVLILRLLH